MSTTEPLAYLHGRFLPQSEAHLPFHDAGFVFGATATDLCRTFLHRPFRLADHLVRFRRSCRFAQIPLPITDSELARSAEQLVAQNAQALPAEEDLALVLFATPGPIGYYAGQEGGPGDGAPTLGMHTFPLPLARYQRLFQEGAHLVVPCVRHVPAVCVDPRVKQRSRMHWWLAEREAQRTQPGAMALLLDTEGYATETAGANFLLVRDGVVLSPPGASILAGVSLQTVRELCGELDIHFEERPLRLYDCLTADEAMLASTPYCLAGVSRINDANLPWPGKVYLRLLERWSKAVGLDIGRQILPLR
jgi:branched-subunit amino acid aminotransferase/4-amino-4-deoxychorismate lyase